MVLVILIAMRHIVIIFVLAVIYGDTIMIAILMLVSFSSNTYVQTCLDGVTTYSGWNACSDSNTRRQTVTTRPSACAPSGCYVVPTNHYEYLDCGGGQYCIGSGTCCSPSWSPSTSTVCSGTSFTQYDGCGHSRGAVGTKNCCTTYSGYNCGSCPTSYMCSGEAISLDCWCIGVASGAMCMSSGSDRYWSKTVC